MESKQDIRVCLNLDYSSCAERRRLQNRLSQRKFRKNKDKERRNQSKNLLGSNTNNIAANQHTGLEIYSSPSPNMKDTVASYPPVGSEYDSDLFNIQTLLWQPQTLQAFDVHSSSALNGSWAESGTDPNRLTFDTPLMDQITNASMTSPAISLDGPSPAKSFVTLENDPHNWNPLVNSLESNRCTFPKANNYSSSITPKCISKHRSSEKTLGASPSLEPLLHISARKGDCDVLRTLLKYRSDINMRDSNGRTALHVASEHGHQKAVSLLLRHGADVEALDLEGKSPLYLAVVASKNEVANVLLSYKY